MSFFWPKRKFYALDAIYEEAARLAAVLSPSALNVNLHHATVKDPPTVMRIILKMTRSDCSNYILDRATVKATPTATRIR